MGVEYRRGWGSYRSTFRTPPGEVPADSVWRLESEGFYGTGDLWLNGRKVAALDGQFLGFSEECGPILNSGGMNTVGIRLTNRCGRNVLPGIRMPDFTLHGGLAGRLRLVRFPSLRFGQGIFIRCEDAMVAAPVAAVFFSVANSSSRARAWSALFEVEDGNGSVVATSEPCRATSEAGSAFEGACIKVPVPGADLWSIAQPRMYWGVCRLLENGTTVDEARVRFGFRKAEFRPDSGFFLNGERIELRGVNRHESLPGFGNAMPECLHRLDAELIKSMGCNFVRLSHYPQHTAFLDACDELGILVYAEIASWKSVRTGAWLTSACRQMRKMVVRDRNHPSVILWGMGNESRSRKAFLELKRVAGETDPTRPVIYAENHMYRARREHIPGIPDVWGCNYAFKTEENAIEDGRDGSCLRSVVISECSNQPETLRGDTGRELEQVRTIEEDLALFRNNPCVAGFALWCFGDYGTLRKRRFIRYSGLVDAWRMPKMSAALMRAMFTQEPFMRTFRHTVDGKTALHVFTNCDETRLEIQGAAPAQAAGGPHLRFELPSHRAEARLTGRAGDRTVTEVSLPPGKAVRVTIVPERQWPAERLASIIVCVTAADGQPATDWSGEVPLFVDGPARLARHTARNGILVNGGTGRGFLYLSSPPARIRIETQHADMENGELTLDESGSA